MLFSTRTVKHMKVYNWFIMFLLKLLVVLTWFVNVFVQGNKYNVLFVVVDDLRPALGIYDDPNAHTPNLDKLGQQSVVFTRAFAQQALCAPSRNSFLTSRRPDTLHLYDFYNYWRHTAGNFTTLPQHFKNNGYITHSVGKVFHPGVSSNFTDDYPISWTFPPFHPRTQEYKNAKVCVNDKGTYGTNIVCPVRIEELQGGTLPDLETLEAARKFLKSKNSKTNTAPYFLGVGFHKPHIPLKYPRKYLDYHPIDAVFLPNFREKPFGMPTVAYNPWNDMRLRDDIQDLNLSYPFERIPDNYISKIIQSYSAAVTYIDDLIGNLLNDVDLNKTIVVILGDHGVSMGEHGQFSKYSNFDIATRVPLMIYVPNLTKTKVVSEQPVELLDIFPTLVDLTSVSQKLPTCDKSKGKQILCTEGKSLYDPIVNLKFKSGNNEVMNDFAISQYPRPGEYPTIHPDSDKPKMKQIKIMGYSIRTISLRYTEWVAFDYKTLQANWTHVYANELYNHAIDPNENINLAHLEPMQNVIADLRHKLLQKLGTSVE